MRHCLKNKTGPLATHLVALALALAGCGSDPNDGPVQYQLSLSAFGSDTTAEGVRQHGCRLYGSFNIARPVPASGTVRFPVWVQRDLYEMRGTHSESTIADSTIAEAVLDYVGLGDDSLRLTLGAGSYTATLGPEAFSFGAYSGEWICGPEVPLAQDSTLLAYGYQPDRQIVGTWLVSEMITFE